MYELICSNNGVLLNRGIRIPNVGRVNSNVFFLFENKPMKNNTIHPTLMIVVVSFLKWSLHGKNK